MGLIQMYGRKEEITFDFVPLSKSGDSAPFV